MNEANFTEANVCHLLRLAIFIKSHKDSILVSSLVLSSNTMVLKLPEGLHMQLRQEAHYSASPITSLYQWISTMTNLDSFISKDPG